MISIESLHFAYPQDGFSLQIPRFSVSVAQKLAVIGPSGSGKTTLLNLLAGIYRPDTGHIQVAGLAEHALSDAGRRDFRITQIGFVFQDFQLLDYLSVLDNILHPYRITRGQDSSVIIGRSESNVTANAKLVQYTEITEANIEAFHLHGNPAGYPLTAAIALPHDDKAAAILRGRYQSTDSPYQIVPPADVIDTLMTNIFRIRNVLDAVILVVGLDTLMALVLVFALSLRLRQREIDTIFKLGCSRLTIAQLLGAEIILIAAFSAVLSLLILAVVSHYDQQLVRALFI